MKLYLLITSFIGLCIAILIIWLIRKDHLHVKYAFGWILVGVLSAILGFFPSIVDTIAHKIGISYPPILAIVIAFSLLLIKLLLMDIERSRQQRIIIRLTQRLAILDAELHSCQVKIQPPKSNINTGNPHD